MVASVKWYGEKLAIIQKTREAIKSNPFLALAGQPEIIAACPVRVLPKMCCVVRKAGTQKGYMFTKHNGLKLVLVFANVKTAWAYLTEEKMSSKEHDLEVMYWRDLVNLFTKQLGFKFALFFDTGNSEFGFITPLVASKI